MSYIIDGDDPDPMSKCLIATIRDVYEPRSLFLMCWYTQLVVPLEIKLGLQIERLVYEPHADSLKEQDLKIKQIKGIC